MLLENVKMPLPNGHSIIAVYILSFRWFSGCLASWCALDSTRKLVCSDRLIKC